MKAKIDLKHPEDLGYKYKGSTISIESSDQSDDTGVIFVGYNTLHCVLNETSTDQLW